MKNIFKPIPKEFEPKRDNRFVVEFPESFEIAPWIIQSITMPKLTNDKWENIELSMMDPIGPSASKSTIKLIDFCKKNKPGFFKKNKNLFTISISLLDATGVGVEKWTIDIKELISVDFGNLDYREATLKTVKIILKPGDCRLN